MAVAKEGVIKGFMFLPALETYLLRVSLFLEIVIVVGVQSTSL